MYAVIWAAAAAPLRRPSIRGTVDSLVGEPIESEVITCAVPGPVIRSGGRKPSIRELETRNGGRKPSIRELDIRNGGRKPSTREIDDATVLLD
jgi:hypothetical protein